MAERPLLITTVGPSFAGKSTLLRKIGEHLPNTQIVSGTQTARRLNLPTSQRILTSEERQLFVSTLNAETTDLLENGTNVLYDSANPTKDRRDRLRKIATNASADLLLIHVDTPWTEVIRRWEENKTKPETERRSDPPLSLLKQVWDIIEPPSEDEAHINFHPTDSDNVPEWIKRHAHFFHLATPKEQPNLYILTGLPFSGKSSFAREFSVLTKSVHADIDTIANSINIPTVGRVLTPDEREFMLQTHKNFAQKYLELGQDVVYDAVNTTALRREELREFAESHGAKPIIIYVNTPWETTLKRWKENGKKPETKRRAHPPRNLLDYVHNIFEVPREPEKFIVFDGTNDSLPEWLEINVELLT